MSKYFKICFQIKFKKKTNSYYER
ncbi:hypothetical protein F383_22904 [Gossypium arboreum]|uniref:Uncharacterized protein n=1 Tax=Gossypium arboreum TaxID=29729 RepID=A0A0B0NQ24_GOSAR|nr:hypothetical protein F383_22904 [Gossypium arboreum]KHG16654.1 hypothetical protein F383_22904 [Gossypium arboreum]